MSENNLAETKKRRAALHNLGCKVNAYETEAMRERLEEAGYEIVDFTEAADVYVVNTCTVTAIADKKSRQMLRRARRLNPDAVIVAAGCFAEGMRRSDARTGDVADGGAAVEKNGDVREISDDADIDSLSDIWLGNRAKDRLVGAIEEFLNGGEKGDTARTPHSIHIFEPIDDRGGSYETLTLAHPREHTRAFLKVQDGCDRFCSYCLIPYARGRSVSRPIAEAVAEADRLAAEGFGELVLTGIHLSSYEPSLIELIERLQGIDGIKRLRLGSLEPIVVTEEFAGRLAACDKVCPHFHLSLQSGCDATLRAMNRRYTTGEYAASVEALRRVYDDPAITTDVIAGFPGESEADFEASRDFVRSIGFAELHVFPFSRREGTAAARLGGQLSNAVKSERAARLIEAGEEMSEAYRARYDGRCVEALLEERLPDDAGEHAGLGTGFTREYIKVAYTATADTESGSVVTGIFGRDFVPIG